MSGLTNNSLKKAASEWRKDNKNVSEINKGLFNKEATKYRLFPISAESKNSLREFASNLAEYIREARKEFFENFLKNFFRKIQNWMKCPIPSFPDAKIINALELLYWLEI